MTDGLTLGERIAIMETEIQHIREQNEHREKVQQKTADQIEDVSDKMDSLLYQLERYKGFFGGCIFVFGAIWAFLKMGVPYLMKFLGKE